MVFGERLSHSVLKRCRLLLQVKAEVVKRKVSIRRLAPSLPAVRPAGTRWRLLNVIGQPAAGNRPCYLSQLIGTSLHRSPAEEPGRTRALRGALHRRDTMAAVRQPRRLRFRRYAPRRPFVCPRAGLLLRKRSRDCRRHSGQVVPGNRYGQEDAISALRLYFSRLGISCCSLRNPWRLFRRGCALPLAVSSPIVSCFLRSLNRPGPRSTINGTASAR